MGILADREPIERRNLHGLRRRIDMSIIWSASVRLYLRAFVGGERFTSAIPDRNSTHCAMWCDMVVGPDVEILRCRADFQASLTFVVWNVLARLSELGASSLYEFRRGE